VAPGQTRVGADGFTVDSEGRIYLATALGVQVFDQIGKCHGILPAPHGGPASNVTFGGPGFDELYLTSGDKVFKRRLKARGVLSFQPPITPPAPRL
jgi:sugar lactone lactonase YvrE